MKISIILGHPNPASFNHAIASVAVDTLKQSGHDTIFHDLQAEKFDPVATYKEIPRDAALPPIIQQHCDEILAADGIIIVHPNWWCHPPAILKGWVDRVFRAGMAYNFVPDGKGGAKAVGLLKAKTALIITTANTPQEMEVELYGDPLETFWKTCVFGLCGVPIKERLIFSPVIVSTPEQRATWLQEVKSTVDRLFPRS
jgi:putative NADPH-quinone reductase